MTNATKANQAKSSAKLVAAYTKAAEVGVEIMPTSQEEWAVRRAVGGLCNSFNWAVTSTQGVIDKVMQEGKDILNPESQQYREVEVVAKQKGLLIEEIQKTTLREKREYVESLEEQLEAYAVMLASAKTVHKNLLKQEWFPPKPKNTVTSTADMGELKKFFG